MFKLNLNIIFCHYHAWILEDYMHMKKADRERKREGKRERDIKIDRESIKLQL